MTQVRHEASEPAFNAPWPVLALVACILGGYGLQSLFASQEVLYRALGLVPADLAAGRWGGLVSALFVHGSWLHALLNAGGALAFGAPVARLFGVGLSRSLMFFSYYLACGVLGSLGFALVHWGAAEVLIGASGAVSGLMGAASRLLERDGEVAPLQSRTVVGMAVGWLIVNLLMAAFGNPAGSTAPVAWEAHLFGYAAGALSIGGAFRVMRGRVQALPAEERHGDPEPNDLRKH